VGYYSNVNLAMMEKIIRGEAIDLSDCPREGHFYVLPDHLYKEDMDYCDLTRGWIWSMARRKADGKIVASLRTDLSKDTSVECIWLR
jgi:hypothetical protein